MGLVPSPPRSGTSPALIIPPKGGQRGWKGPPHQLPPQRLLEEDTGLVPPPEERRQMPEPHSTVRQLPSSQPVPERDTECQGA